MLEELGKRARAAAGTLRVRGAEEKNAALLKMRESLLKNAGAVLAANRADLDAARAAGMRDALLDRLALNEERLSGIGDGIAAVAELPDPVGRVLEKFTGAQGLRIEKVSVPIGVIGIIYEARPNVTADAAALCFKAGNACILRGGKEAVNSNRAIAEALREGLVFAGMPADAVCLITDTSRDSARALMELTDYVDVLIPRGGAGLIRSVKESARVPVIETGVGNCHAYVDEGADVEKALKIVINAKCSRVSVCNALESLLVNENTAEAFLPRAVEELRKANVEIYACERCRRIVPGLLPAGEAEYAAEFLDRKISVKIVKDLDEALRHIEKYSTRHSDCIITENEEHAARFLREVDSAAVYVNASTRFTDGGCFGFGAEIGISTQKIHARGPMGLRELTSYKYTVRGNGQIR